MGQFELKKKISPNPLNEKEGIFFIFFSFISLDNYTITSFQWVVHSLSFLDIVVSEALAQGISLELIW